MPASAEPLRRLGIATVCLSGTLEDKLVAAPWGEPMFPGVAYVVVSIWNGKLKEINEFTWNDIQKSFVERSFLIR